MIFYSIITEILSLFNIISMLKYFMSSWLKHISAKDIHKNVYAHKTSTSEYTSTLST